MRLPKKAKKDHAPHVERGQERGGHQHAEGAPQLLVVQCLEHQIFAVTGEPGTPASASAPIMKVIAVTFIFGQR